jgi:hypothetical protein
MRRISAFALVLIASTLIVAPAAIHPLEPSESVYLPIIGGGSGVAPSPTPTPTDIPQDLNLYGEVYDVQAGAGAPIAGARVAALLCAPRTFSAITDAAGRYTLFVPASYANACAHLDLEVSASGYLSFRMPYRVSELLLQPQVDFALIPLPDATPSITPTATQSAGP